MTFGDFAGLLSLQAVIGAVCAWLGKVWAERIAREEQRLLDERVKEVEAKLSAATHITNTQYQREFEIYRDLWEKMLTATGTAISAPAIRDVELSDDADHRKKQLTVLKKAIGEFSATVQFNRPFYAEVVYESTKRIQEFTSLAWMKYELQTDDQDYFKWAFDNLRETVSIQDDVERAIRNRMKQISVV